MSEAIITWSEQDIAQSAVWRSERGASPPKRVQIADDTMSADTAYKLASEGVGLLWRGDFQNAKHLIQALERRLESRAERPKRPPRRGAGAAAAARASAALRIGAEHIASAPVPPASASAPHSKSSPAQLAAAFYKHRQAQAQRARVLGMVLLPFQADYQIPLRRAPDVAQACAEAWGPASDQANGKANAGVTHSVVSLRELLGIISAHEWRKKGVEVRSLGFGKNGLPQRIHAHYGVFSPVRSEYLELVLDAPLPEALGNPEQLLAFDIGTGTGVLAAILRQRGIGKILATDLDSRSLACAHDNLKRLGNCLPHVQLMQADLFPDITHHGRAQLIVCNPPWLPGKPSSNLERAVYDEGSQMLKGFLQGVPQYLAAKGEAWLILSDLAEHLGLRTQGELPQLIKDAGLKVIGQLSTSPKHPKANDVTDPFFAARSREKTHLWRLALA
jgi:methylase of polypeptide subunit release factors